MAERSVLFLRVLIPVKDQRLGMARKIRLHGIQRPVAKIPFRRRKQAFLMLKILTDVLGMLLPEEPFFILPPHGLQLCIVVYDPGKLSQLFDHPFYAQSLTLLTPKQYHPSQRN